METVSRVLNLIIIGGPKLLPASALACVVVVPDLTIPALHLTVKFPELTLGHIFHVADWMLFTGAVITAFRKLRGRLT